MSVYLYHCTCSYITLDWFVCRYAVESALLQGKLLTQQDVKRNIEEISSACLDENIELRSTSHRKLVYYMYNYSYKKTLKYVNLLG